jgi:hypothetical protein
MGETAGFPLDNYIDYEGLLKIQDFLSMIKVVEYLEEMVLTKERVLHYKFTIVYKKEDLDKLFKEAK